MKTIQGVVIGIVKEIQPGEVKLKFPWLDESYCSDWAPVGAPMSGGKRGFFFMPELEDEVLVAFDHGDFDHPFVVGFLWNGKDTPPTDDIQLRLFHSVNGHEIAFYDPAVSAGDRGYIRVKDAHGNVVELANGQIKIEGVGAINIRAPIVTINGRLVAPVGPPI